MDKLKGSQFYVHVTFTQFGYAECSQIECVIYHQSVADNKIVFLKTANESFPNAEIIDHNPDAPMIIDLFVKSEHTAALAEGKYMCEIKRVVSGTKKPVYKTPFEVFTLKKAQTS